MSPLNVRRFCAGLTLAALLSAGGPVRANEPLLDLFADYLEALRVQAGIPGLSAVLIGRDGVLWEQSFGRQDLVRAIPTAADTPFYIDGLTEVFTATFILGCLEQGKYTLDTRLGELAPGSPDPNATIRSILTHTVGAPTDPVFVRNQQRLELLGSALHEACDQATYAETLADAFDVIGMTDTVPGAGAVTESAPAALQVPSRSERYKSALTRVATPYVVDTQRRAVESTYTSTALTPTSGLLTTARDFARFDLALKHGVLIRPETLEEMWRVPLNSKGERLPHGVGWFVEIYNGKAIAWQFGVSDNGSSSIAMTVPERGLTLILLANSSGLVRPFALEAGNLIASPFGRLFLGLLVR